ncbi:MAG: hypothetical protein NVSMB52_00980 [Chloroflexota bacterium]
MDYEKLSNGHQPQNLERARSLNPYADAQTGDQPKEIVEFELNTDPYANVIPRVTSITSSGVDYAERIERHRNPFVVAVSVVLIILLVLPVTFEVLAKLFH